jgi:hypothetical protein
MWSSPNPGARGWCVLATYPLLIALVALAWPVAPVEVSAGEVEPTATASETETAEPTASATPTESATAEPEATPTESATAEPEATPTGTATATPIETATQTPTATASDTPTETRTETPTGTPTPTFTPTPLPTEPLPRTCNNSTNPEPITCGELLSCSLPFTGATKSFTFDALSDDAVCIQTAALDGSPIVPRTQLLGPGFAVVSGCSTQRGGLACCHLRDNGVHRIVVQDAGGDDVGGYTVTLHGVATANRGAALSCGPPVPCGGLADATLRRSGDLDSYRITAVAGDGLYINTATLDGSGLQARWQLFHPNGSPVGGCNTVFGGADSCSGLAETGTYTLIVSDAGADEAGRYGVSVQFVSQSNCCGDSIAAGESRTDVIARIGQARSYVFSADRVQGVVVTTSPERGSPVQPAWRVFAPDGRPVSGCFTTFGGQKGCGALPLSGSYTVIVSDAGSRTAGASPSRCRAMRGRAPAPCSRAVSAIATPEARCRSRR